MVLSAGSGGQKAAAFHPSQSFDARFWRSAAQVFEPAGRASSGHRGACSGMTGLGAALRHSAFGRKSAEADIRVDNAVVLTRQKPTDLTRNLSGSLTPPKSGRSTRPCNRPKADVNKL